MCWNVVSHPSTNSSGNKDYTYRIGCFKLSRKWNSFQIRMTMKKKKKFMFKKNQCSLLLFSFLQALLSSTWNREMRNISCRSTTRMAIIIKMYQIIFSRGWWEVRRDEKFVENRCAFVDMCMNYLWEKEGADGNFSVICIGKLYVAA